MAEDYSGQKKLRRLVRQLHDRDPNAIAEVVNSESRRLYRAARGLGFNTADAEDLTQEVFLTFLETLGRFEGQSSLSTWLYGILLNKARERRRDHRREESRDISDEVFASWFNEAGQWRQPPEDLHRMAEAADLGRAIQACIEALPPALKEVLVLRQIEQLDARTVCNILDRTVTHIGVQLHRARTRLRTCLTRQGWTPS